MRVRPILTEAGRHSTRDLATFNRWLNISRLRAIVGVLALVGTLHLLGVRDIRVAPVLAVCALMAIFSGAGLFANLRTHGSMAYFALQTGLDLASVTVGIGCATAGLPAILVRSLYVLIVVPAGLVSIPMGVAAASGATLGHGLLLGIERGFSAGLLATPEFLVPVFMFFLVAQQACFYGGHLADKNEALGALAMRLEEHQYELQTEARTSAALADVSRTLGSNLDAPELLARVNRTALDSLGADWAATLLVDLESETFRLGAVSDPDVDASELGRIVAPLMSWPVLGRLAPHCVLTISDEEAARVPAALTAGARLGTVLLAGLHREGELVGCLAAGWHANAAPAWAARLLDGIAEHAAIALHNARLLDEVRAASNLKSEFLGTISHELRSPLNVILGYVDMLGDAALGPVGPDQRRALDRVRLHAQALLEMISALLDLNRLEAGRLPIQSAPTALAEMLDEIRVQLPESWRRHGVELRFVPTPPLPLIVTDRGKLKTVLRNLIHNALKFTERGHVTVSAGLGPSGDVVITVADTGAGIPADALPYIFEMFRQAPGAGGGGVGLGLHIVRRFVDALGGSVEVTSEVGIGSRFAVTLPATARRADAA